MPTVARSGKFEFRIYTREKDSHGPHVHVWFGNESIVSIDLYGGNFIQEPPPGMERDIMRAYRPLAAQLLEAWYKLHK